MLKPMTPHQREVFDRVSRQCLSERGYARSEVIGSHGGCFHLVHKGYLVAVPVYGPRGGTTWNYYLTEEGRAYAIKRRSAMIGG